MIKKSVVISIDKELKEAEVENWKEKVEEIPAEEEKTKEDKEAN